MRVTDILCEQLLLMKYNKRNPEQDSSRQEGPPHSNLMCWSDWPMAVPAVTRQNTSPATELTLNLSPSLRNRFFFLLLSPQILFNTFALTSSFPLTKPGRLCCLFTSTLSHSAGTRVYANMCIHSCVRFDANPRESSHSLPVSYCKNGSSHWPTYRPHEKSSYFLDFSSSDYVLIFQL